jgi:hypothetical protein
VTAHRKGPIGPRPTPCLGALAAVVRGPDDTGEHRDVFWPRVLIAQTEWKRSKVSVPSDVLTDEFANPPSSLTVIVPRAWATGKHSLRRSQTDSDSLYWRIRKGWGVHGGKIPASTDPAAKATDLLQSIYISGRCFPCRNTVNDRIQPRNRPFWPKKGQKLAPTPRGASISIHFPLRKGQFARPVGTAEHILPKTPREPRIPTLYLLTGSLLHKMAKARISSEPP